MAKDIVFLFAMPQGFPVEEYPQEVVFAVAE